MTGSEVLSNYDVLRPTSFGDQLMSANHQSDVADGGDQVELDIHNRPVPTTPSADEAGRRATEDVMPTSRMPDAVLRFQEAARSRLDHLGALNAMKLRILAKERSLTARLLRDTGADIPNFRDIEPTDEARALVRAHYPAYFVALDALDEAHSQEYKRMLALAAKLPCADWKVRGFGIGSFAILLAETGALSGYANPAKVWKRMGLAVFDGKAQGRSKDDWERQGYNPRRHSVYYQVSIGLVNQNKGEYRKLYDDAKAAKLALGWPKMRADLHGRRIAVKALIKHLWRRWRDEGV